MYSNLFSGKEKIGEIELTYPSQINFAKHINKASGTQRLTITNTTAEDLREVNIAISGEMVMSRRVTLPRIPAKTTVGVAGINIDPIFSKLANLTEGVSTEFSLAICVSGEQVLQMTCPLYLMAYNHCLNGEDDRKFIAAFSLPNHPAVTAVVKRAAEILAASTEGTCFIGYPSDFFDNTTVKEEVKAVWEALKELHLHYVTVHMTTDVAGQRVRLVPDVIKGGVGNCLDLSLLLCSCLEAVGLCPCVVIIEGHAFVAVNMYHSLMLEQKPIAEWRTCNAYIPIEATLLCQDSKSLDDAIQEAEQTILNSKVETVVDISRLRQTIRPLPLAIGDDNEYKSDETDAPNIKQRQKLDNRMTLWERKLLDLTMRNNLVTMRKGKGLMPIASKSIDEILVALDNDDIHSFAEERKGFGTLKDLYLNARQSLEETGGNTLFLAIGTLRWYDPDNKEPHFAPLMLIPVEIERQSAKKYIVHRMDNEPMANITLMECLRQKCDIEVPDMNDLPKDDNGDIDLKATLDMLRESFDDMKEWQVVDEAMLGIFSFTKFVIWNDIHSHRKQIGSHPLVKGLVEGFYADGNATIYGGEISPTQLMLPVPADNSQLQAISAVDRGQSFVLCGPPGTGKSQTITAMIASALGKGKRVLFVSEKKAALEVVQHRLEQIGLGDFCLELHSNKVEKKHFLSQMERVLSVKKKKNGGKINNIKQEIEALRRQLDGTTKALHDVRSYGRSLYDDIDSYLSIDAPSLDIPYSVAASINEDRLTQLCEQLVQLDTITTVVGCHPAEHPLSKVLPYENTANNQQHVEQAIAQLHDTIEAVRRKANGWINRIFQKRSHEEILFSTPQWEDFTAYAFVAEEIESDINALQQIVSLWHNNISQLRLWYHFSVPANALRTSEASLALEYFMQGHSGAEAAATFRKGVYKSRVMHALTNEDILRQFNGVMFERTIAKLRNEQKQFMELAKKEILCRLINNATTLDATADSELTTLKRRIASRGRGTSIRTMLDQTSHVMPHLAPCMLMSPLSVAQYLQMNSNMFDLVIFDEASQLPTCEAIGAIARGKTLVVVGDPQQMPPTNFFNADLAADGFSDTEDLESVLDDCMALSMPVRQLNVHYRSAHESLISFSNVQFYDGKLTTFPSADNEHSRVTFRYVDGVYDAGHRRTNRAEAEALVDELIGHLQAQSNGEEDAMSIGVIAFNKTQSMLIEDLLTQRLSGKKKLERLAFEGNEPVFVKNLENVQGDERDIILFSVGYGPDKNGHVSMNFGPLNIDGGHRRLNVAVTRARRHMKVFSSLHATDIDLSRTTARGVEALRNFLVYAETGQLTIPSSQIADIDTDAIAKDMASRLADMGYKCHTGVGSSQFKVDVAVLSQDDQHVYNFGILVDGHSYADASLDDRELVRPQMLSRLGWTIHRVWAVDWINQPQRVMNELVKKCCPVQPK